jgi:transposase
VFIIGIDPHKGSHTVVAIDSDERLVGEVLVRADRRQRERLLRWASEFKPRLWAVEGATGTGAFLAQQLVGAGETVLDVPPALSARARLLDSGHKDKTDPYDARSAVGRADRRWRGRGGGACFGVDTSSTTPTGARSAGSAV